MNARERVLDVSDLPPPEPLEQALAVLDTLAPGEYLRMRHRREPLLLYPILEQRGLAHQTVQRGAGRLEIFIWRRSDGPTGSAAREAAYTGIQRTHAIDEPR